MSESLLEQLPLAEVERRIERCRTLLQRMEPEAGGMLVCSRISIYYLTGTLAMGLVWIPLSGKPVLMVRKGLERARIESPLEALFGFKSYKELSGLCAEAGSPLAPVIAVDKNGFNWSMAEMLQGKLPGIRFVSCDAVLSHAKSVKSEWELEKMRRAGQEHALVLDKLFPTRIHSGMSEYDLARVYANAVFERGCGIIRMNAHGEENFIGSFSVGDSSTYPTYYNGPIGLRGQHPAVPFMGNAGQIWTPGKLLAVDPGFSFEGYNTDRTQCYWLGAASTIPDQIRRPHDACVTIFQKLASLLKPGVTPAELWNTGKHYAEQEGWTSGFMGLGPDSVPFLGHGIGLTVDEYPAIARSFDEPVEPGMVFAIEPKIGIPGVGMVGLEHTLEVTADGCRSLTGTETDIICLS